MLDPKKKALLATLVFFAVFFFATANIVHEKRKSAPSDDVVVADSPIIFYYGYSCPHCEIVEEYLDENDIASKVRFSKKEVYKNKANAAEAIEKAAQCGIGADELGVPFLWDGENCYIGDQNIIDFFKKEVEEKGESGSEAVTDTISLSVGQKEDSGTAETPVVTDTVFYYGVSCPHCKVVEEYIETNRVGEKISFARKEISQVPENQRDFIVKASGCGIASESLGVPMLYFAGECYLGEDEIINFFKGKSNEG